MCEFIYRLNERVSRRDVVAVVHDAERHSLAYAWHCNRAVAVDWQQQME